MKFISILAVNVSHDQTVSKAVGRMDFGLVSPPKKGIVDACWITKLCA